MDTTNLHKHTIKGFSSSDANAADSNIRMQQT